MESYYIIHANKLINQVKHSAEIEERKGDDKGAQKLTYDKKIGEEKNYEKSEFEQYRELLDHYCTEIIESSAKNINSFKILLRFFNNLWLNQISPYVYGNYYKSLESTDFIMEEFVPSEIGYKPFCPILGYVCQYIIK